MKKIVISLAVLLVVLITSAVSYAVVSNKMVENSRPSDYKIGMTYEEALAQPEKPFICLMYVDWCTYCKKFMPRYRTISKIYKDKYNFVMMNVEDPKYKKLADEISLSGFPTVYVFDTKYDNRFMLSNGIYMDLKKFRTEADRYLRIRAILDSAPQKAAK